MHILKSIVIAFSMYSKIPMPQFEWKEEDMKHVLCFFPWIGIVIGICVSISGGCFVIVLESEICVMCSSAQQSPCF